jgi:hypothetical protein
VWEKLLGTSSAKAKEEFYTRQPTIEAQISAISDDVANDSFDIYTVWTANRSIAPGKTLDELRANIPIFRKHFDGIDDKSLSLEQRVFTACQLVANDYIADIIATTTQHIAAIKTVEAEKAKASAPPLLSKSVVGFSSDMQAQWSACRAFTRTMIRDPRTLAGRALTSALLIRMFDEALDDGKIDFLTPTRQAEFIAIHGDSEVAKKQKATLIIEQLSEMNDMDVIRYTCPHIIALGERYRATTTKAAAPIATRG